MTDSLTTLWLIVWLTCSMTVWLTGQRTVCLTDWMIDRLMLYFFCLLVGLLIDCLMDGWTDGLHTWWIACMSDWKSACSIFVFIDSSLAKWADRYVWSSRRVTFMDWLIDLSYCLHILLALAHCHHIAQCIEIIVYVVKTLKSPLICLKWAILCSYQFECPKVRPQNAIFRLVFGWSALTNGFAFKISGCGTQ